MRFLSQIWQPAVSTRHPPQADLCKSQRLLWECGLVRAGSHGLPVLLPLAARALHKLETLVAACLESAGASRACWPSLVPASLWQRSGRLAGDGDGDAASELFSLTDRQHRRYLLAPTHEECFASLLAETGPVSHKQLPVLLYQLSSKFRDELRPKHGLLRARQFRMMDCYGAHGSQQCAANAYDTVTAAYRRLFDTCQITVHRVEAPGGAMGGSLSHEWQLPAAAGEDRLAICPSCSHARLRLDGERDGTCRQCGGHTHTVNSIEVGHTFSLGTLYSGPLEASFVPPVGTGSPRPLLMTCYGVGLTRLLAASVEALSSESSIVWPEVIAPYRTLVIGPKEGSKEALALGPTGLDAVCAALATSTGQLGATAHSACEDGTAPSSDAAAHRSTAAPGGCPWYHDDDILVDDRHHLTVGKRLRLAEKTGYPVVAVLGRALLRGEPSVELRRRDVTAAGYRVSRVPLRRLLVLGSDAAA